MWLIKGGYLQTLAQKASLKKPNSFLFKDLADCSTVGYQLIGEESVITVKGHMMDSPDLWDRVFGAVDYGDIVDAIDKAEGDNSTQVVLVLDTPGGTVAGLEPVVSAIRGVKKRSIARVKNLCASAGYWIASACDEIEATSRLDEVGSIGVILNHAEYTGFFSQVGVTHTEVASGTKKGVGSPFKPLSEEDRAELGKQIGTVAKIFFNDVAEYRNLDVNTIEGMQAATFYAEEALTLKLIDRIAQYPGGTMSETETGDNKEPNQDDYSRGREAAAEEIKEILSLSKHGASPSVLISCVMEDASYKDAVKKSLNHMQLDDSKAESRDSVVGAVAVDADEYKVKVISSKESQDQSKKGAKRPFTEEEFNQNKELLQEFGDFETYANFIEWEASHAG